MCIRDSLRTKLLYTIGKGSGSRKDWGSRHQNRQHLVFRKAVPHQYMADKSGPPVLVVRRIMKLAGSLTNGPDSFIQKGLMKKALLYRYNPGSTLIRNTTG